ncbi:MAG: hypothetical protein RRC34_14470 [Lentisphaeria bacterium]|nr:hypothetical protein [Lentisphaeria bacterium]
MNEHGAQAKSSEKGVNRLFSRCLIMATRHRRGLLIGIAILIPLGFLGLTRIRLENNIEAMLPADRDVIRGIQFLREAGLSDKIALSLTPARPDTELSSLFSDLDRLADELAELPLVDSVTVRPPVENILRDITEFCRYSPQLTAITDASDVSKRVTAEAVNQAVNSMFNQLLSPGGGFALPFFQNDPLGFSTARLRALRNLADAGGYNIHMDQGYLLSEDGDHALMILTSPVPITAGTQAKALLDSLDKVLKTHGSAFSTRVVSGHRHAVSNEDIIRRDVKRACLIAGAGFFLLFVIGWRDPRAGIIFLIPFLAVLLAINATASLLGTLSYFILGMAGVVTGISIDYGIHVYVAQKQGGSAAVTRIFKPVTVGALTTVSVFASFFFSSVAGYAELAWFSILSILLSLLFSLLIIPQVVTPGGLPFRNTLKSRGPFGQKSRRRVLTVWAICLLTGLALIPGLKLDTDIRSFDGSDQAVFDDEAAFQAIWSDAAPPAFLVVEGKEFDQAFTEYARISREAEDLLAAGELNTLASVWRPRAERIANLKNWRRFWTPERRDSLRDHLAAASQTFGFADDAFAPFLTWLDSPPTVENPDSAGFPPALAPFKTLLERFVVQTDEKVMFLAYFPDTAENVDRLASVCGKTDDTCFLVSRNMLALSMSRAIQSEIVKLSIIAMVLIIALLVALLRRPSHVVLASIPVVTALICMFGMLRLCGVSLNAASIIAGMVVVGLSIDYGVFMVYERRSEDDGALFTAVTLSALTTVTGSGALLFAAHPVMRAIAVALSSGVAVGYFAAVLVIPALIDSQLFKRSGHD